MPYDDPDPTDPNTLVGVVLPGSIESLRDMAYVFAEEFARLGYGRSQILTLFKTPHYTGAHGAYRALGEHETLSIIDECVNAWGGVRFSIREQNAEDQNSPSSAIQKPKSKIQNEKRESDDG
jgi:hypothetical protein